MEKLQKALDNARQDRKRALDSGDYAKARGDTSAEPGMVSSKYPPIWDKLKPMELDENYFLNSRVMTLNARPEAGPLDMLRTKIWLLMRENGWTRLAITSPNKDCGKTTIACNLAVGFSRQQEIRSVFMDLDLRQPSVANILGQYPDHEVKDMLSGSVKAEDQMLKLLENEADSMSRRPVKDPAQVLLSKQTADCFDGIQKEFEPDLIIFDVPPMLVTDDARAVLKNVDCALIVARAEYTRVSQIDVCEREVSEYTNVLGVVLNSCRHVNMDLEDTSY